MKALLDNSYAPITHCLGVLESPYEEVVAADREWSTNGPKVGRYKFKEYGGSLPELLDRLLPLGGSVRRQLWIEATDNHTAYFDNGLNGSDPFSPISHLSRKMGCRGYIMSYHPDTEHSYGQVRLDVYQGSGEGAKNLMRSIAATNDGGSWSWDASGEPMPFEDSRQYEKRKIKERFTGEMLDQYCRALGVPIFDESFFGRRGTLSRRVSIWRFIFPWWCTIPKRTLAEAQKRLAMGADNAPPARNPFRDMFG